ncbi:DMT family transporter [Actinosynnema sp. ALI-1.44]|uniref:DMT family transporter n=1 Tax=Actinosynnema sp. ALI-1.44 TaxID=1933779 RepID=UPI0009FCAD70|nr:DMT family transporter [Actinosynnema sp. ALI-1.44]
MTKPLPLVALLVVTATWGGTFVVVKDVTQQAPPMDFLAVRFLLAAGILALWRPSRLLALSRKQCGHGVVMGLLLSIGYIAQTFGQQYTSASMSGFITGMSVVFTPVVAGVLLRQRIGLSMWATVAIATGGLAIMTLRGFAIGFGDGLTLLCALFFALHVIALSEWSTEGDAYALTVVQLGVVGVLCLVLGVPDGMDLPASQSFWIPVLALAVVATAGAYLVQTWAQARLSAVVAALALTMEPVFASVFGALVDGDEITARVVLGGVLVVGAMAFTARKAAGTDQATVSALQQSAGGDQYAHDRAGPVGRTR